VTTATEAGRRAQCASAVLVVRPAAFGANPETASTNAFQAAGTAGADLREQARAESDALAAALDAAGVEVLVLEDTPEPARPDACFPNNWLSLHHDGTAVLYPMLAPSRRRERRDEALALVRQRGFVVRRVVDLTYFEGQGAFLEGTGSLVLDHRARVAYACRSPRTHAAPLLAFGRELGYATQAFDATGPAGEAVYHTNVVMSVGEGFAVACLEAVADDSRRHRLRGSLEAAGREVLEVSRAEMNAFAGNLLQLATRKGGRVIALSATALAALGADLRRRLERHGGLVAAPVPVIERYGGGSVRCMLAEVFLPREP
jgi:hypothetical protein